MHFLKLFLSLSFVLAFAIGNVYKVNLFSPEIHISFLDLSVLFISASALIFYKSRLLSLYKRHFKETKAFGYFLLSALVSLCLSLSIFPASYVLIGGLYLVRFVLYVNLLFVIPACFTQKTSVLISTLLAGVVLTTSFFQYLVFPDIRNLQIAEWDPHYFRVVGSFLDPGFTALVLIFVFFFFWLKPIFNSDWKKWLAVVITYLLLSLTYSRSGFMAFLAGWAYLSLISKSPKKFFVAAGIVAATLLLLPRSPGGEGVKLERTSSIEARITNWRNSLTIFADHPLVGVGFNTYRYAQKNYGFLDNSKWLSSHAGAGADSSLLFVAATTGVIGLYLYLKFVSTLWEGSKTNLLFRTYLIALVVHSLFLNSAFYPYILFWLSLNHRFRD